MSDIRKFNELEPTALASIGLKVLTAICMVLTAFIPIMTIDFKGSGVDAVMTIYSFNIPLKINEGISSSIPTNYSVGLLNDYFLLVIIGIIVTLVLNFVSKNRWGGLTNTFSVVVLLILFINYYLAVATLNGQTESGITLTITTGLGYFLLILGIIFLIASSFTKFKSKAEN